ncbi:hypothetical protein AAFF_G00330110 [Aldrovandia affinis]|uniref:Uncharacterized protein n=1 Tax=Aldrovandia affinis TaxID=143900 RepID=A0AAD7WQB1_9TELE|nr:hypothetical protein AAFF_G00330110 [Aldrovandia affinis]
MAQKPKSRAKLPRPDRSNVLHTRLSKAEGEIELLKSQLTCEKASWDRRFVELQRKQQDLREQLASETFARARIFLKNEPDYDNEFGWTSDSSSLKHGKQHNRVLTDNTPKCGLIEECPSVCSTLPAGPAGRAPGSSPASLWENQHGLAALCGVPGRRAGLQPGGGAGAPPKWAERRGPWGTALLQMRGMQACVMSPQDQTGVPRLQTVPKSFCALFEPGHGAFVTFDKLLMVWE